MIKTVRKYSPSSCCCAPAPPTNPATPLSGHRRQRGAEHEGTGCGGRHRHHAARHLGGCGLLRASPLGGRQDLLYRSEQRAGNLRHGERHLETGVRHPYLAQQPRRQPGGLCPLRRQPDERHKRRARPQSRAAHLRQRPVGRALHRQQPIHGVARASASRSNGCMPA